MQKTEKYKFWIKFFVLILITLFLAGSYSFLKREVRRKDKQLEEVRVNSKIQDEERKVLSGFRATLQAASFQKSALEKLFIKKKEEVSFIESIEKIIQALGVSYALDVAQKKEADTDQMFFKAKLEGDFPKIARFINALENMDTIVEIESFSIQKKEVKKEGEPFFTTEAQIDFKAHVLK